MRNLKNMDWYSLEMLFMASHYSGDHELASTVLREMETRPEYESLEDE